MFIYTIDWRIYEHDRHTRIDNRLRTWIHSSLKGNLWRSRRDSFMTRRTTTSRCHSLSLLVRTTKPGRVHFLRKCIENTRNTRHKQRVRDTRSSSRPNNTIRTYRTSPNKIDLSSLIKEKISVIYRRYTITSFKIFRYKILY